MKTQSAKNYIVTGAVLAIAGITLQFTLPPNFTAVYILLYVLGGILVALGFYFLLKNKRGASGFFTVSDTDKMSGPEFEQFLADCFNNLGFDCTLTKKSGDFGADLIMYKDKVKYIVQAKRYSKNVSLSAVQEISAAKNYYRAENAWVVTTSGFTKAAIKLAEKNNVRLISRSELCGIIERAAVKK